MKMNLKHLAAMATFAAVAFTAHAQTAGLLDLVVGFKQTGATNNVMIDFGNVNNYTAPGVYTLGNFDSILDTNFTNAWNSSTTLNWGAAATWKDPAGVANTQQWVTKQWTTAVGTLGLQNSTSYAALANSQLNSGNLNISKAYTGIGSFTVGVAESILASDLNSWSSATTAGAVFTQYAAASFNNQAGRLATGELFSASDLYSVGNSTSPATTTQFIGTFALYQNGDLTFTVAIPEPSTYAAILGAAVLGLVMLRRRNQAALV
jgi:PEP-CTERM motif